MTETVIEISEPLITIVDDITQQEIIDLLSEDTVASVSEPVDVIIVNDPVSEVLLDTFSSIIDIASLDTVVTIQDPATVITVQEGQRGADGIGGLYYQHNQTIASAGWNINHNLGKFPNTSIIIGGEVISVPIHHVDENTIYIEFVTPQQGKAILS